MSKGEGWHQWDGGGGEERVRKVNTVQKMCTHANKSKNGNC
jgi:hypothetical protein